MMPNEKEDANPVVLSVRGLRVRRGTPILNGVDWEVRRGEHWVVLGPNGCGKTSLLAVLCGFLPPTDGEVFLLGETYGEGDYASLKRRVGLVSSTVSHLIEPGETALEVVVGGEHGVINLWEEVAVGERRRAKRVMRDLGIGRLGDRFWGLLSQGERQRVLIARALMSGCEILILDEPCAGLDPVARERFLRFLNDAVAARKDAPSIVLVTHHVEEIIPAISHALVLGNRGRVVGAGEVRKTVSTRVLTDAFAAPVRVTRRGTRWSLGLGDDRASDAAGAKP